MRRSAILICVVAAALSGGVVLLLSGGFGRDAARDVAGSLGLLDDPPFRIDLSGPLWQDRTLRSEDGARDIAYVTSDEPLTAVVTGDGGARISGLELRVDGRAQQRVRPPCPGGRCPTSFRFGFVPRLGASRGDHRVQVIARDRKARRPGSDVGSHVSVASIGVHVGGRLPAVREREPVTATATPSLRDEARIARLRARALRVISAERSRGRLGVVASGFRVLETGELTAGGQPFGATLLLELTTEERNVTATLPAYIPAARSSSYRAQAVRMRAAVLRDLLVDIDLERDRVIAVEPGPRSSTLTWAPSRRSSPVGAADED